MSERIERIKKLRNQQEIEYEYGKKRREEEITRSENEFNRNIRKFSLTVEKVCKEFALVIHGIVVAEYRDRYIFSWYDYIFLPFKFLIYSVL